MTPIAPHGPPDSLTQCLWASLSRAWLEMAGEPPKAPLALPAGMRPR
jgi:hypothetical protein